MGKNKFSLVPVAFVLMGSNVGAAFTAIYQNHPRIDLYSGDQ